MIEHLVINGGGPTGLLSYSALKTVIENGIVNMENIKTIYGTSIGAIIGIILSLKYDLKTLDDYLIKRPWDNVIKIKPEDFFEFFYRKSILSFNFPELILQPLLEAKDLSMNITMKEFYEFSNIEHHIFTVELNSLKTVDINYKTFPDLTLIKALEMTSAFPFLCKPVFMDGNCYIDGGFINNYPLNNCIKDNNCPLENILGVRNTYNNEDNSNIKEDSNFLKYFQDVLAIIVKYFQNNNGIHMTIPYEIKLDCTNISGDFSSWTSYLTESEKRVELFEVGVKSAKDFLDGLQVSS
tara:strand:+ start:21484 stop:22371 length:888 start_codon:yes stop_codon:yes gene_type:complete